jgi:hypothetical protein
MGLYVWIGFRVMRELGGGFGVGWVLYLDVLNEASVNASVGLD